MGFLTLVKVFLLFGYIVVSTAIVVFTAVVFKKKSLPIILVIIPLIIIPFWDILLGVVVYSWEADFGPKTVIYEKAKADGICSEGIYNEIYQNGQQRHRYTVTTRDSKFGTTTVRSKKVIDLSTNKLMGECAEISRTVYNTSMPAFNWLMRWPFEWWEQDKTIYTPGSERCAALENEILNVKKPSDGGLEWKEVK